MRRLRQSLRSCRPVGWTVTYLRIASVICTAQTLQGLKALTDTKKMLRGVRVDSSNRLLYLVEGANEKPCEVADLGS